MNGRSKEKPAWRAAVRHESLWACRTVWVLLNIRFPNMWNSSGGIKQPSLKRFPPTSLHTANVQRICDCEGRVFTFLHFHAHQGPSVLYGGLCWVNPSNQFIHFSRYSFRWETFRCDIVTRKRSRHHSHRWWSTAPLRWHRMLGWPRWARSHSPPGRWRHFPLT